jgi:hypothetical protein
MKLRKSGRKYFHYLFHSDLLKLHCPLFSCLPGKYKLIFCHASFNNSLLNQKGFGTSFYVNKSNRKQTMKRIITLLIAFTAFSSVFAQTTRDEARRVIFGQPKNSSGGTQYPSQQGRDVILGGGNNGNVYGNNGSRYPSYPNTYPSGSREAQIDQINREYDARIYSIRYNRRLSSYEKDRMIRQLEQERARRIRAVNNSYRNNDYRYARNNRRYDDDDDYNERNYKGYKKDNGKHLGWYKGRGNPHKYGGKKWDD